METEHEGTNGMDRMRPRWHAELAEFPAHLLSDLPAPCELWLQLPRTGGCLRVLTGAVTGAGLAVGPPSPGATPVRTIDGEAWRQLALATAADRFTAADLEALCDAPADWVEGSAPAPQGSTLFPETALADPASGAEAWEDVEPLSLDRVLRRLGARLDAVRLVEAGHLAGSTPYPMDRAA